MRSHGLKWYRYQRPMQGAVREATKEATVLDHGPVIRTRIPRREPFRGENTKPYYLGKKLIETTSLDADPIHAKNTKWA